MHVIERGRCTVGWHREGGASGDAQQDARKRRLWRFLHGCMRLIERDRCSVGWHRQGGASGNAQQDAMTVNTSAVLSASLYACDSSVARMRVGHARMIVMTVDHVRGFCLRHGMHAIGYGLCIK
jgi:hypothetical protein